MEKIALFGCSRGLGLHVAELLAQDSNVELLMLSRRIEYMKWPRSQDVKRNFDLTKDEYWERIMELLRKFNPTGLIYMAGGGPYGTYGSKEWKDQDWALSLSFRFPAFLLNQMAMKPERLKKFIIVGSQIAESKPDPGAAMYCASKHALCGLVHSVQKEEISFDLRLFSPGYMDTQMLPANAWPRQQSGLVKDPRELAQKLVKWYGDDTQNLSHWKE